VLGEAKLWDELLALFDLPPWEEILKEMCAFSSSGFSENQSSCIDKFADGRSWQSSEPGTGLHATWLTLKEVEGGEEYL
jgi:hypothetical protein